MYLKLEDPLSSIWLVNVVTFRVEAISDNIIAASYSTDHFESIFWSLDVSSVARYHLDGRSAMVRRNSSKSECSGTILCDVSHVASTMYSALSC